MGNEFHDRLQWALSESGMTASELSEKTGISEANISNYLKGKYVAKQDKCYLLAKALNVDPGWLMVGSSITPVVTGHSTYIMYDMDNPPQTTEARILAKGIDAMPQAQREAIVQMMMGLYPGMFEKGTGDDDA